MARVRNVKGGTEKHTQVVRCDRIDPKSGAYHEYGVFPVPDDGDTAFASIRKKGSIRETLHRIYEAGGKAWDDIDDPDKFIREMRGNS